MPQGEGHPRGARALLHALLAPTPPHSRVIARSQVAARRFCLVAADHPLVSAISENAEKLQSTQRPLEPPLACAFLTIVLCAVAVGEISMMPSEKMPLNTLAL